MIAESLHFLAWLVQFDSRVRLVKNAIVLHVDSSQTGKPDLASRTAVKSSHRY